MTTISSAKLSCSVKLPFLLSLRSAILLYLNPKVINSVKRYIDHAIILRNKSLLENYQIHTAEY